MRDPAYRNAVNFVSNFNFPNSAEPVTLRADPKQKQPKNLRTIAGPGGAKLILYDAPKEDRPQLPQAAKVYEGENYIIRNGASPLMGITQRDTPLSDLPRFALPNCK